MYQIPVESIFRICRIFEGLLLNVFVLVLILRCVEVPRSFQFMTVFCHFLVVFPCARSPMNGILGLLVYFVEMLLWILNWNSS